MTTLRTIGGLLLAMAPLAAQTITGEISGVVLDPAHRPIPGALVRAVDQEHGLARQATTDEQGGYRLVQLPPARYALAASSANFEQVRHDNVRLLVDSRLRLDFVLPVAGMAQSIQVTAPVEALARQTSELGMVLDDSRLRSLPLNRRDFLQLALLAPGILPPTEGSELSSRGSVAMHANGAREEFNNFLLDGVENNDPYTNRYLLEPPVDSIQEFKIASSNYSAEYGRSAGAQVNVITRGGGNRPRTALYEYLRNRALDARNFFDGARKPQLIGNQFGAAAGGPVVANRAFFSANFDGLRARRGLSRLAAVPTLAERSGNLAGSPQPVVDPFTGKPFPGGVIPLDRISRLAPRVLDLFPLPSTPGSGAADSATYLAQPVLREANSLFLGRFDYRAASSLLTVRYGFGRQEIFEPYAEESTDVPGFGDVVNNDAHNAMVHYQRVCGPRAVNSLWVGFARSFRQALPENYRTDVGGVWAVDWLHVRRRDFGFPAIQVRGYSPAGDAVQLPLNRHTDSFQAIEGLSLVRGPHNLKLGGEVSHTRLRGYLDYFARGSLVFSGALTGSGIGDLLLGLPSFAIQAQFDNRQALLTTAYNAYAQDDWTLARNLTLNLGLRYEYNTPPVDPADRMSVFEPAGSRLVRVGTAGVPRAGIRSDRNNLAPRVGFAWSPLDSTVIRGGYGVFYDSGMLVVNSSLYFNPPYFNVRLFFPTRSALLTLDEPFPSRGGITPPPSPNTLSPDLTTSSLQQWNVGVQRQVSGSTVVSLAYAGSKGTHLIRSRDLNQPRPAPGPVAARRPNPAFGGIFLIETGANSVFHSLQASVDRRLSRNLALLAAYTWSKSIDDTSAFLGTKADKNFPQDSNNYRAERAVSSFHMPHRLTAAWIYSLPQRHWLARNTEVQGIATLQSGQPFTPVLRFDNSNTGNTGGIFGSDRPNVLRRPAALHRPERWFDTSAFAVPPPYAFGSAGRNILRGPWLASVDLALARDFAVGERSKVSLLVQAFNVLNRTNFDLPERFADEPGTFGKIFSARAPREIQLGLRFSF